MFPWSQLGVGCFFDMFLCWIETGSKKGVQRLSNYFLTSILTAGLSYIEIQPFSGVSGLFFPPSTLTIWAYCLLDTMVPAEKSVVNITEDHLHMISSFSVAFKIFSLSLTFHRFFLMGYVNSHHKVRLPHL